MYTGKDVDATGKNESLDYEFNDGVDDVKKEKNKELQKAMIDAGMTQTKLAEATGLHLTNINAIVNGTRPRVDTAVKIAKVLHKSVEELWPLEE